MCDLERFSQIQSHITTYHIAMALLASAHLVLTCHDYIFNCRPPTSIYDPTRANTFSLDHVISRGLFICDWICKNRSKSVTTIEDIVMTRQNKVS